MYAEKLNQFDVNVRQEFPDFDVRQLRNQVIQVMFRTRNEKALTSMQKRIVNLMRTYEVSMSPVYRYYQKMLTEAM